eukprot:scaffold23082_cov55-Attheya_sp.AAC.3
MKGLGRARDCDRAHTTAFTNTRHNTTVSRHHVCVRQFRNWQSPPMTRRPPVRSRVLAGVMPECKMCQTSGRRREEVSRML